MSQNPDLMNAIGGALPGACGAAGSSGDWTGTAAQTFLTGLETRGYTVVPVVTTPVSYQDPGIQNYTPTTG
jgi:hypothetical protein